MSNSTLSYSSDIQVSICQAFGQLKDPNMATEMSLTSSRLAMITSILTCPMAAFLNFLVLLAFYRNSSLRKKANVFLCALAMIDMSRSFLSFSLFLTREVIYQKRLQPSCFTNLFLMTTEFSVVGELILFAMNCERFIALRYPIWHQIHATKSRLVKTAVICFFVGVTSSQIRNFTEAGRVLNFVLFSFSWLLTLFFSVLIWKTIKKRNQLDNGQSVAQHYQDEKQTQRSRSDKSKTSLGNDDERIKGFQRIHSQSSNQGGDSNSSVRKDGSKLPPSVRTASEQRPQSRKQSSSTFPVREDVLGITGILNRKKADQQNKGTFGSFPVMSKVEKRPNKRASKKTPMNKPHAVAPQLNAIINVSKSERKVARIATYLAVSLIPTRIIPAFVFLSLSRKLNVMFVTEPWLPTLTLLISLVNPVIYIGANQKIRQMCVGLIR